MGPLTANDKFDGNILSNIFSYLSPPELLIADMVTSLWHEVVRKMWRFVRDLNCIKHLTYKPTTLYSDKHLCYRAWNARTSKEHCGTLMIVGGTRDHLNSTNSIFCFKDDTSELRTSQTNRLQFPSRLSSSATCVSTDGEVMTLGGWNGIEAVANTYSYNYFADAFDGATAWRSGDTLPHPTCFAAASTTLQGHILLNGGGDAIWKGALVYNTSYLYKKHQQEWVATRNMNAARCGHTAVTTYDGHVVVLGGYGGGTTYFSSVEAYVPEIDTWIQYPDMLSQRSGNGSGYSSQGSIYVTGGSSNGLTGLRTTERYDPREGKWFAVADMIEKRGYTAACFGGSDVFYVAGGINKDNFKPTIEYLDVRMNKWQFLTYKSAILWPKIQKNHLRRADCQMVYMM